MRSAARRSLVHSLAPSFGVRLRMTSTRSESPVTRCSALAIAALLVCAVAFDPNSGVFGIDGTLTAKRVVLEVAAFLGLAAVALESSVKGRWTLPYHLGDGLLLAFVGLAGASVGWAVNGEDVARDSLMLVAAAAIGLLVRADARRVGPWRALSAFVLGAIIAGATDLALSWMRGDNVLQEGAEKFGSRLFPHHNLAALVYAPAAAATLALVAFAHTSRARALGSLGFLLLAGFLYSMGSKAALIAILAGPLVYLAIERGLRWVSGFQRPGLGKLGFGFALAVLGGVCVLVPFQKDVSRVLKEQFNRACDHFGINYSAAYMRPMVWKNTFEMFKDHELLGVGYANFQYVLPAYDPQEPLKPHAHNQFLQVLAELGIVGLLLFVALCVFMIERIASSAVAGHANGDRERVVIARATGFALFVFLLQSVFEPPLAFPFGAIAFFTLYGLATAPSASVGQRALATMPLLRFAIVPGLAASILMHWTPRAFALVTQSELARTAFSRKAAGDLEGAIEKYRLASTAAFDQFALHVELGELEGRRGRFEPALAEYRKAIELFPNFWKLHQQSAICLLELDRTEAARAALARAEQLQPGRSREFRFYRGRALLRAGQLDDAIEQLESYKESMPESSEVLRYCADARYERSRRDRSLEDAGLALRFYQRYVAIGGVQKGNWVDERIAALGHWMRVGRVILEGDPPARSDDSSDGK